MRQTRLTMKTTVSALALTVAVLAFAGPVRAAEDDTPIDTKIFRGVLESLGLRKEGEAINYQQRAPLVSPPGKVLPPPERSEAALANPSWPVDPDVTRAKQEAAAARRQTQNPEDVLLKEGRPLRPDELTPGPKPRGRKTANGSYESSPNGYGSQVPPSELGQKGNLFSNMFGKKDEEVAKFTGEPPRASLTEPPRGYQTPSPDQPYGTGKDTSLKPKKGDYLTDHPVGVQ